MTNSMDSKSQEQKLSNEEVFKVLNDTQQKYEKYLEVSSYVFESPMNQYEPVKRDINSPLAISFK